MRRGKDADEGVISLLVGEMAGRPEGGAKDRNATDLHPKERRIRWAAQTESRPMPDTANHEARIAELEKLVHELQAQLEALQKQAGISAKPAEKPLRSRGMLGSPTSSR